MMLYRRTEELEMPGTDVLDFFSETCTMWCDWIVSER